MASRMEANRAPLTGAVRTNQRGLITKILSRYASKYFALKELIQNADDAQATEVDLFLSRSEGSLERRGFDQMSLRNNGRPFSAEDWDRIRTIASGNPNEKTVGYFGVGFFSVFALSDSPELVSGAGTMRFFWGEGGQLYTDFKQLEQMWPCTEFKLPLKPDAEARSWEVESLERFLAKALLFPRHLRTLRLFVEGEKVVELRHQKHRSEQHAFGANLARQSPAALFTVSTMELSTIHVSAHRADGSSDECELISVCGCANLGRGKKAVALCTNLSQLLSKQLPAQTTVQLLFSSRELNEQRASADADETVAAAGASVSHQHSSAVLLRKGEKQQASPHRLLQKRNDSTQLRQQTLHDGDYPQGDAFDALLSPLEHGRTARRAKGRIFIGFETHQLTGGGFHVNAQLFPTMERTAVDFAAAHVSQWNKELISVAGLLSRAYYDHCFGALCRDSPVDIGGAAQFPALGAGNSPQEAFPALGAQLCSHQQSDGQGSSQGVSASQAAAGVSSSSSAPSWDAKVQQSDSDKIASLIEGWKVSQSAQALHDPCQRRAVQLLRSHLCVPVEASPQTLVGQLLSAAIWQENNHPLQLWSTLGPRVASKVLLVPPRCQGVARFMPHCPLLPDPTLAACSDLFAPAQGECGDSGTSGHRARAKGKSRGKGLATDLDSFQFQTACSARISRLSASHCLRELSKTIFDEAEISLLLRWYLRVRGALFPTEALQRSFFDAVQVCVGKNRCDEHTVHLCTFKFHADVLPSARAPGTASKDGQGLCQRMNGLPLPHDTLPVSISQHLSHPQLQQLQLKPLTFWHWWLFVRDNIPSTISLYAPGGVDGSFAYAAPILRCIEQHTSYVHQKHLTAAQTADMLSVLSATACIPSISGHESAKISVRVPNETYVLQDESQHEVFMNELPYPTESLLKLVSIDFLYKLGVRQQPSIKLLLTHSTDAGWGWPRTVRFLLQQQPKEVLSHGFLSGSQQETQFLHAKWESWLQHDDVKQLRERVQVTTGGSEIGHTAADTAYLLPRPPEKGRECDSCTLELGLRAQGNNPRTITLLPWGDLSEEAVRRISATESAFMLWIGVREHPSLTALLALAASDEQLKPGQNGLACPAFRYLVAQWQCYYGRDNAADAVLGDHSAPAFVPAQTSATAPWQLYKFEDCFVELNPFGMPTLASVYAPLRTDTDYDEALAEKQRRNAGMTLGMRAHPPLGVCVKCMIADPPGNGRNGRKHARMVFSYLGKRFEQLSTGDNDACDRADALAALRDNAWVPIEFKRYSESATSSGMRVAFSGAWATPDAVFFDSARLTYGSLLQYTDCNGYYSESALALALLRTAGVRNKPGPEELCHLIAEFHERLPRSEPARYVRLLEQMQSDLFPHEESLTCAVGADVLSKLAKSSFAINANDPTSVRVRPKDTYIIDTLRYHRWLPSHPAAAPGTLHLLYHALGAQMLSQAVNVRYLPAGATSAAHDTRLALKVASCIDERAFLLLYDTDYSAAAAARQRSTLPRRPGIQTTAENILSALKVKEVSSIERTIAFEGQEHRAGTVACCYCAANNGQDQETLCAEHVLYVTAQAQLRDVAQVLTNEILFRTPQTDAVHVVASLLELSIDQLREAGTPVDQLLQRIALSPKHRAAVRLQRVARVFLAGIATQRRRRAQMLAKFNHAVAVLRRFFNRIVAFVRLRHKPATGLSALERARQQIAARKAASTATEITACEEITQNVSHRSQLFDPHSSRDTSCVTSAYVMQYMEKLGTPVHYGAVARSVHGFAGDRAAAAGALASAAGDPRFKLSDKGRDDYYDDSDNESGDDYLEFEGDAEPSRRQRRHDADSDSEGADDDSDYSSASSTAVDHSERAGRGHIWEPEATAEDKSCRQTAPGQVKPQAMQQLSPPLRGQPSGEIQAFPAQAAIDASWAKAVDPTAPDYVQAMQEHIHMQSMQQAQLVKTIRTLNEQMQRTKAKANEAVTQLSDTVSDLEGKLQTMKKQRGDEYEAYKSDALKLRQQRALLMKDNQQLALERAVALGREAPEDYRIGDAAKRALSHKQSRAVQPPTQSRQRPQSTAQLHLPSKQQSEMHAQQESGPQRYEELAKNDASGRSQEGASKKPRSQTSAGRRSRGQSRGRGRRAQAK